MLRCATAAVLTVLASVPLASAAEKAEKAKKPTGAWTHTVNDCTVTFTFEHNALQCDITKTDGEAVHIETAYGVTPDDLLFGVVTKVEKKGTDAGPEKGDLFSFEYKIEKDELTLSDLNGSKPISDEAKQLLTGQFMKKK